jgi:hypothetical protein
LLGAESRRTTATYQRKESKRKTVFLKDETWCTDERNELLERLRVWSFCLCPRINPHYQAKLQGYRQASSRAQSTLEQCQEDLRKIEENEILFPNRGAHVARQELEPILQSMEVMRRALARLSLYMSSQKSFVSQLSQCLSLVALLRE